MRDRLITLAGILVAGVGWWGLYELTGRITPDRPGALALFFALLFLALTGTFLPPAAYLNRRFAAQAVERDPWRFLRHSAWAGLCVTTWGWLQMHRTFDLGLAFIIALLFVTLEGLIVRLRK